MVSRIAYLIWKNKYSERDILNKLVLITFTNDATDEMKESLCNQNNVTEDQKKQVKDLRDELQKAIDENDYDKLRTKLDELEKAAQAMSEAMYQQQANAGAGANTTNNNDDVVDADFKTKE